LEEKDASTIAAQLDEWSRNLTSFLEEIRQRTLQVMAPLLVGAAILLGMAIPQTSDLESASRRVLVVLFLLVLAGVVWLLRQWSYQAAAWVLIAGSLGAILRVLNWAEMRSAVHLLPLVVAMVTLLTNRKAGATAAALLTVGLWFAPPVYVPAGLLDRNIAVVEIWAVYSMISIVLSPLVTATAWAWSGYQQSLALLKQVRDYNEQNQQALSDLAKVNAQLTRLNQHAQQLRLTAEEERRIKEQFVANISHELRTPLNMIIGFSEMILKAPENYSWNFPSKLLADLDVIQRNSQHLSELVDDVLDLSQIEAGRMALTREYVNLPEIIQAAVVAVRYLYESKHLTLEIRVDPDLPQVYCDRTRIREVVLNLLSNAGRFTETGGVCVRAWGDGLDVVVSVADTGAGIAKEDQARLFQPFHQVDSSLRRQHGGTGLGLSLSKSFVELHDGKMWLESEKDRGTTVFFRLPIEPQTPLPVGALSKLTPDWEFRQRTRRLQAPLPLIMPKLVVVEKGDTLKSLLIRHFDGYEIVSAPDIPLAIQDINRTPAQALLVNDPAAGEGPPELAIEKLSDLPLGIPVLTCSLPEPVNAERQLGVDGYLTKPIAREKLLEKIAQFGPAVKTVLVADDDTDAQQLFHRMLTSGERKYRVLRATDGRQALDILQSEPVDLVMLDLMMPEVTGYEILAQRRVDAALQDIPFILITARDPWDKPIASPALTVTSRDGLNVQDLLACIEALSGILSKAKATTRSGPDPTLPASLPA
jgi:signal transduction histidine kinase/CheY-like chemotaxis protein